jgi:hypothetical protein
VGSASNYFDSASAVTLRVVGINDIPDVNASGATSGQILKFDGATSTWELASDLTGSGSGVTSASDLSDVNTSGAGTFSTLYYIAGAWRSRKNTSALGNPSATDDENNGYELGSRWYNVTAREEYVLLDETGNNAVWKSTTLETYSSVSDLTTALDSTYANVSGDTFTGDVTFNTNVAVEGNITISGTINSVSLSSFVLQSSLGDLATKDTVSSSDIDNGTIVLEDISTSAKTESFIVALSDESTSVTTSTSVVTIRMPYAFTLTDVRANVNTAPTGANLIVDINESGSTILSTKLSIDATEKTSVTASQSVVISDTALSDDAEITFDIDQVGSTEGGKGLKIALIGYQTGNIGAS